MLSNVYRQTKSGGGKLKLRALALSAEGGDEARFEVATLLREAARAEERALRLLPMPAPETRLGVAVECCGCLVDARAPRAAALAWGDVLIESEGLPGQVVRAHRAKLDAKYASLQREHERALALTPTLNAAQFLWLAVADKARARKELDLLIAQFPGEIDLWYTRYQASFFDKDYTAAWHALEKARALDPSNLFVVGSGLMLTPKVFTSADAEARLDAAYSIIRRAGAELDADTCLCFGAASFEFAEKSARPRVHYERALDAAELGAGARLDTTHAKPILRVVRALALELLAGREPTIDVFYRAGRGDLVARAPAKDRKTPMRILTRALTRVLEPLPSAA